MTEKVERGSGFPLLGLRATLLVAGCALAAFHLAFAFAPAAPLIAVFIFCTFTLARAPSPRVAFYLGLALGMLLYAPHLTFFWLIFGPASGLLWGILALWIAGFLLLSRLCVGRLGRIWAAALIPFLWTGLEFFRGELYHLKFSWLAAGYALSARPARVLMGVFGVYGLSFALMALSAAVALLPRKKAAIAGAALMLGLGVLVNWPVGKPVSGPRGPLVVGVQLEAPEVEDVLKHLDRALEQHPGADLLVLSEYTFMDGVPRSVTEWCRRNGRYLVAGSTDYPGGDAEAWYDTAFVVGPDGEVAFKQAKSVPIQFFADGLPAETQEVWASPWGPIGVCICYDLSYARVTDALIRKGARALVVPTMDAEGWGRQEHVLHTRVAPVRAAEYGVPVFRLGSSGISQAVRADGTEMARAPFPGQGEIIAARLNLEKDGRVPPGRYLTWLAAVVSMGWAVFAVWLLLEPGLRKSK